MKISIGGKAEETKAAYQAVLVPRKTAVTVNGAATFVAVRVP
jgi:hypothetical protein